MIRHSDPVHRVLVTGSRKWDARAALWSALDAQVPRDGRTMVLVHGGASGADALADAWGRARGVTVEQHPANWRKSCDDGCRHQPRINKYGNPYCPAAGVLRNQLMVDLGAHICLAFFTRTSVGTQDCVDRAKRAGIPVLEHWV
jgi:hypothetical protein